MVAVAHPPAPVAEPVAKRFEIDRIAPEQRLAFGRAYVQSTGGRTIVDHQGEWIEAGELERVAHEFMSEARAVKVAHGGRVVGTVVESMVTTAEKAAVLGTAPDEVAWWVAVKIHDPDVWDRVRSGELAEFSFGGEAVHLQTAAPEPAVWSDRIPESDRSKAVKLDGLVVRELSLVPRGAGLGVRIAVTKEDRTVNNPLSKIRWNPAALPLGDRRAEVEKALKPVAKAEVLTLADVQEQLPEELWSVVLAALDAKAMETSAPAAPAPPMEEDKAEEPAAPPMEEEKMGQAMAEEEEKMAETMKALEKRLRAAEGQLETERHERRLAEVEGEVAKSLSAVPMESRSLAELVLAARAVAKSEEGTPIVLSRKTAKALEEMLSRVNGVLEASAVMKRAGSSRDGSAGSAYQELERRAAEVAKERKITPSAARIAVAKEDPALSRRVMNEAG